jgi:hypothetical protein
MSSRYDIAEGNVREYYDSWRVGDPIRSWDDLSAAERAIAFTRPYGRPGARRHVLGARLRSVVAWVFLWACACTRLARAHAVSFIWDLFACFGIISLVILIILYLGRAR